MFTSPARTTRERETTTGIRDTFVVPGFGEITCQFWIRAIWAILEHIFVRVYVYMCMCMCTSTCVCVRVHMSTYRHICVHVYVYVCTTPARPACIPLGTRRPSCLRASRGAFRRGPSKAPPPFYTPPSPHEHTHTQTPPFPRAETPPFPPAETPPFPGSKPFNANGCGHEQLWRRCCRARDPHPLCQARVQIPYCAGLVFHSSPP